MSKLKTTVFALGTLGYGMFLIGVYMVGTAVRSIRERQ